MEQRLELVNLFRRERAEIIFAQTNDQKRTGNHIVDMTVLITERTVCRKSAQFALFVADYAHAVLERINCLDVAIDRMLQVLERCANLHNPGIRIRLNEKNGHGVRLRSLEQLCVYKRLLHSRLTCFKGTCVFENMRLAVIVEHII